ncbi:MAG: NUDIX domain-containing protein [Planctomycetes bacterium]|nr:NUDIX domain-containing protein [Planctomycetota bacterium]
MTDPKPSYAAAIIERHDQHFLIALTELAADGERLWSFPRGSIAAGEPPEVAMRRIVEADLGLCVEIVIGQPPIVAEVNARDVQLRYFFCGVVDGEAKRGPYADIRWTSKAHLREYDFDQASTPVVKWILDS